MHDPAMETPIADLILRTKERFMEANMCDPVQLTIGGKTADLLAYELRHHLVMGNTENRPMKFEGMRMVIIPTAEGIMVS